MGHLSSKRRPEKKKTETFTIRCNRFLCGNNLKEAFKDEISLYTYVSRPSSRYRLYRITVTVTKLKKGKATPFSWEKYEDCKVGEI